MYLKKLNLIDFKNYPTAEMEFGAGVTVFTGKNGSGKTNILDAIHYLSMCKSYFNAIDSQNIMHAHSMFVIQGEFELNSGIEKVFCGLKLNQKKQFKRNNKEYSRLSDHIGLLPVVMVAPVDHFLITGISEERRRLMDSVISQIDKSYLESLIGYTKILMQRNAYLKQIPKQHDMDMTVIQVWNEQLVALGNVIYNKRKDFLQEFEYYFLDVYKFLTNSEETVSIFYDSQLNEGNFDQLLQSSISKDRILQYTSVGIHKDDLVFNIGNHPVKRFGSQGQQKTFLIALKLAQFEWISKNKKLKPILLLDDIFDKLDDERVNKLMSMVSHEKFGQIFITDTHAERVEDIFKTIKVPIIRYAVENGMVERKN